MRSIRFSEDSAAPDHTYLPKFQALKDEPLSSKAIIELLTAIARTLPDGATGIRLEAERFDRNGIELVVTLTTTRIPTLDSQKGWEFSESVRLDNRSLHSRGGFSSYEYATTLAAYDELVRAIDKVTGPDPDAPFKINIWMIQSE